MRYFLSKLCGPKSDPASVSGLCWQVEAAEAAARAEPQASQAACASSSLLVFHATRRPLLRALHLLQRVRARAYLRRLRRLCPCTPTPSSGSRSKMPTLDVNEMLLDMPTQSRSASASCKLVEARIPLNPWSFLARPLTVLRPGTPFARPSQINCGIWPAPRSPGSVLAVRA